MKMWYQGRFTKLSETRTYSVESIIYLLYIIATNFDSKKFRNLEEGESAIMIWESVKQSVKEFIHMKFSSFLKREVAFLNISKNFKKWTTRIIHRKMLARGPPKNNLIWENFTRETFASPIICKICYIVKYI